LLIDFVAPGMLAGLNRIYFAGYEAVWFYWEISAGLIIDGLC
jgi:hypothetical protein